MERQNPQEEAKGLSAEMPEVSQQFPLGPSHSEGGFWYLPIHNRNGLNPEYSLGAS